LQRDVLGYITASGGGVDLLPDLENLTDRAPFELESLLGGVFEPQRGKPQRHARYPPPRRAGVPVVHETLRSIAEQQYGATQAGYRDRIHRWADGYRGRGWPQDTRRTYCVATHAC
jgi:hypothetical protein